MKLFKLIAPFVLTLVCLGSFSTAAPTSAQNSDPASVLQIFQTALNSQAVDGATGFFAPDAVVTVTTSMSTFSGQKAIRDWIQSLVDQHALLAPTNAQANGAVVVEVTPLTLDVWTALGVGPLDSILQAVVLNGKIKSLVISITPAAQAKLSTALAKYKGTDAASVLTALTDLINSQKAEVAIDLFTDDAIVTTVPPSANQPGVYSGKTAIQSWLKGLEAQKVSIEHGLTLPSGLDSALSFDRISLDSVKQLGIDSLDEIAQLVVQNGKIKSFTVSFTLASLAKINAVTPK